MKNMSNVVILAGAWGLSIAPGVARAEVPEHAFSGKAALYSEYEYRGISQTSEKPAAQLNLDYAHRSGFYAGTFVSNIKWLKDTAEEKGFSTDANIEWGRAEHGVHGQGQGLEQGPSRRLRLVLILTRANQARMLTIRPIDQ
jgi:hypothetical protein